MNFLGTEKTEYRGKKAFEEIYYLLEKYFSNYDNEIKGINMLNTFCKLAKNESVEANSYLSNKENDLELNINAYGKINEEEQIEMHFYTSNYHEDERFSAELGIYSNEDISIVAIESKDNIFELEYHAAKHPTISGFELKKLYDKLKPYKKK
ncbi:MAG: hypothetical protein ACMXX9_02150 [Candidatus Woesearchaeota archaeon]